MCWCGRHNIPATCGRCTAISNVANASAATTSPVTVGALSSGKAPPAAGAADPTPDEDQTKSVYPPEPIVVGGGPIE